MKDDGYFYHVSFPYSQGLPKHHFGLLFTQTHVTIGGSALLQRVLLHNSLMLDTITTIKAQ